MKGGEIIKKLLWYLFWLAPRVLIFLAVVIYNVMNIWWIFVP